MKTCDYWYRLKNKDGSKKYACGSCKDCKKHIETNNTDKWHP